MRNPMSRVLRILKHAPMSMQEHIYTIGVIPMVYGYMWTERSSNREFADWSGEVVGCTLWGKGKSRECRAMPKGSIVFNLSATSSSHTFVSVSLVLPRAFRAGSPLSSCLHTASLPLSVPSSGHPKGVVDYLQQNS